MWFIRPPVYTGAKSSQSVSGWWIARVINTEKERDLLSVVELRCFSAPWTSCFKITGDRVSLGKGLHFYWKPTTFKWPESWRTIKLSNSPIIKSFIWQIFHCWGNSCVFPPLSQEIKPLTYANCWQGMETNGLQNMNRDSVAPSHSLMGSRAIHKSRAAQTQLWFHNFLSNWVQSWGKMSLFLKALCQWEWLKGRKKYFTNTVFCCCIPSIKTYISIILRLVWIWDAETTWMGPLIKISWGCNRETRVEKGWFPCVCGCWQHSVQFLRITA